MYDPEGLALRGLDPAQLRALLRYDPQTGELFWRERPLEMFVEPPAAVAAKARKWNARYAGKPAFTSRTHGYRQGCLLSVYVYAHRVAWAIHHGRWSEQHIDHINGVRDDNRITNLREVRDGGNNRNLKRPVTNSSGAIGVYRQGRKWWAGITYRRRAYYLGSFETKEAAIAARKAAERRFGFHPNHGRDG